MGYSRQIQDSAMQKIEDRRLFAEQKAEVKKEKIFKEIPQAENYEREISSCGINAARAVLRGGNVKEEIEKLRNESLKLQEEYKELLSSHGYTAEDLEPDYYCKKCNDTGYVEIDNKTLLCSCLKQARVDCACDELNRHSPLKLCTFEDFSLEYYSKDVEEGYPRSSYEQMKKIYKFCRDYADTFTPHCKNLFMRGMTGLGKTHLCLAIANEVIRKGYGVIYVSAPSVISKLEKEHFSYSEDKTATEDALLDCDLLIIDDLGTEFSTQFSTSAIYNIFNSRLLSDKPVIINTNLSIKELEKQYSQRFVSRITGQAVRLDFFGKDIRVMKK